MCKQTRYKFFFVISNFYEYWNYINYIEINRPEQLEVSETRTAAKPLTIQTGKTAGIADKLLSN